MSGVAAILGGDGARAELARSMIAVLQHRGRDGATVVDLGPLGLAHASQRASEDGPQPASRGALWVSLDGFLTNRADLATTLGAPADAPDADLLLRAYERWGAELGGRLRGELSFVLWDDADGRLVAVRDALGLRPLYWAFEPRAGLRLASAASALFADGFREHRTSRAQLGLAAVGLYNERDETLLEGVRVVPPSHTLVARAGQAPTLRRHRSFDLGRVTRHGDPRAHVEQFRAELERAVRTRLRRGRIGAHVSGGLDSSSVAVVARAAAPVTFFHAAFRGFPCDERAWAREVARHAHEPLVEVDAPRPTVDKEGSPWSRVDPTREPIRELFLEARSQGVDVMLTGWGGDEALDWKGHEAAEALLEGRVGLALAWTGLDRAPFSLDAWRAAARFGVRPLLPRRARSLLRRLRPARRFPLLSPDLEELARAEVDRRERLALETAAVSPSARAIIGYYEGEGDHEVTLRDVDRLAASAGVELRHPLYDVDLIQLVVSTPFDERTQPGTSKVLLRRALPDLLPDSVRLREGKAEFSDYWDQALRPLQADLPRLLTRGSLAQRGVLRAGTVPAASDPHLVDVLSLELWLRHHDKRGCDGFL